jgi:hypothetical protein
MAVLCHSMMLGGLESAWSVTSIRWAAVCCPPPHELDQYSAVAVFCHGQAISADELRLADVTTSACLTQFFEGATMGIACEVGRRKGDTGNDIPSVNSAGLFEAVSTFLNADGVIADASFKQGSTLMASLSFSQMSRKQSTIVDFWSPTYAMADGSGSLLVFLKSLIWCRNRGNPSGTKYNCQKDVTEAICKEKEKRIDQGVFKDLIPEGRWDIFNYLYYKYISIIC